MQTRAGSATSASTSQCSRRCGAATSRARARLAVAGPRRWERKVPGSRETPIRRRSSSRGVVEGPRTRRHPRVEPTDTRENRSGQEGNLSGRHVLAGGCGFESPSRGAPRVLFSSRMSSMRELTRAAELADGFRQPAPRPLTKFDALMCCESAAERFTSKRHLDTRARRGGRGALIAAARTPRRGIKSPPPTTSERSSWPQRLGAAAPSASLERSATSAAACALCDPSFEAPLWGPGL